VGLALSTTVKTTASAGGSTEPDDVTPTVDQLSYVPLSAPGAGVLFDVFSQHYERGSRRAAP
jgi:hypothetical protein